MLSNLLGLVDQSYKNGSQKITGPGIPTIRPQIPAFLGALLKKPRAKPDALASLALGRGAAATAAAVAAGLNVSNYINL